MSPAIATRRFRVALSFPGKHRDRVEAIAGHLAHRFDRNAVFFYHWHLEELNGKNMATYLLPLYRDQADVVVFFHCQAYADSNWCGLEWNAGLTLLLKGDPQERMMFMRFDEAEIPGLPEIYNHRDISAVPDQQVADEILRRFDRLHPTKPTGTQEAYTAKLPATDSTLIGRDQELAILEAAWQNEANLVQVIAPGGTGKTALMTNWYKRHVGEAPLYGWSFYKQGTGDNANVSSDDFLNHAVGWFQLQPKANTAEAKAEALVHHLRQHRTLLILDGLEPLQNQATGELNDYALKDLLRELSTQNAGLVLCTSRVTLADLPDVPPLELDNLTEADGARYLDEKFGVHGSEEDLRAASKAYGNHALALTLLGTYLKRYGGDVTRRFEIDDLPNPAGKPGDHAKRVMQSYAKQFAGQPEGDILRGLGFFDRPAEREALKLILPDQRLDEAALVNLQEARLILTADAQASIDCHPLVREHFGALTKASDAEGFRTGHSKLFDYYCQVPKKEQPDTLEELTPLFHAVAHGCHAGRHQEVCDKVYFGRILRSSREAYLIKRLGALGANLSLLAHFFEQPWSRPVSTVTPADQVWITSTAAFALRALGRPADAVDPMRAGAEADAQRHDWKNAAIGYSNLSELLLTLGRTAESVAAARQSVDYADRSGDDFQRLARRATLADALHHSGGRAEAARLFAEALQKDLQPTYPLLYSLQGYRYCDLLLAQSDHAEALRRATKFFEWRVDSDSLLDIGLDHLTLGRVHPPGSPESRQHLHQAVAFLRRAGHLDHLPKALLARATDADLAEVHKIATRSGMRLHLTDYHLAMARSHRSLEHLEKAEKLIQETGYHRRDEEAAALRAELSRGESPA